MKFEVKILDLEARGKLMVVLDDNNARQLGVISSDRLKLKAGNLEVMAILNTSSHFPIGSIGVFKEVMLRLNLHEGDIIDVQSAEMPESLTFIREKIMGEKLSAMKIRKIVEDVVEHHLSDIELSSFVTALQINGTSMEEVLSLSQAMVENGKVLKFNEKPILDKHSIGGVPGDKTTLLFVPIVAAAGYTIPKSSSRAITSPAGTADRMECLAPVNLGFEKIMKVIESVGACVVWGGSLDLAPADDLFIRVEYPLSIDPLLLPSILSKKKAMGASHVVIDIPTGRGSKMKTIGKAQVLARDFIDLGNRLGMSIQCAVTEGEQPIGYAVGPILEAIEALQALMGRNIPDLIDKATTLAGILFEMTGERNGKKKAESLFFSGKAEEAMRQIIEAQEGDPEVKPEDLKAGKEWIDIETDHEGLVLWINNRTIVQIARTAGAPNDKGAGLILKVKLGDKVAQGDTLLRIYAENTQKLKKAAEITHKLKPIGIGDRIGETMLITKLE